MVARLRMRKRARGGLSPVMEPYSRNTREVSRQRPSRMSMYLGRKMVIFKVWFLKGLHLAFEVGYKHTK